MSEIKYYLSEHGGLIKLVDKISVYSLDFDGKWIPNQRAISMFVDGMVDYVEIPAEEKVMQINKERSDNDDLKTRKKLYEKYASIKQPEENDIPKLRPAISNDGEEE